MAEQGTVVVRPMRKSDLEIVDRVFRVSFGTSLGLAEPERFAGERELVRGRWLANPEGALVAELDGEFAGSNFATNWGSVAFFGPLTVRPDLWNRGIAQRLLDSTMAIFERWGVVHAGLFTFAQSTKHVHLYQRFGFWPRYLTATLAKQVAAADSPSDCTTFSSLSKLERERVVEQCAELTGTIYAGLDVRREIVGVAAQGQGDTILVFDADGLESLAVCHWGSRSEADTGECYAKFAAVRPRAGHDGFDRLLAAWEAVAASEALTRIVAGVNMARHSAYTQLLERGFRSEFQGVTMHKPNEAGYDREDVFLLDDWR